MEIAKSHITPMNLNYERVVLAVAVEELVLVLEKIHQSQVLHRYLPRCLTVFSEDAKVVAEQVLVQKVQTALRKLTQQDKEELVPEELDQLALHPMETVMH